MTFSMSTPPRAPDCWRKALSAPTQWLCLASLAASLLLVGCGGSSYDPIPDTLSISALEYNPTEANLATGVNSGRTVSIQALVLRTGNISNGDLVYAWTQQSGPTVALRNATTATVEFTAPTVSETEVVVLQVRVSAHDNSKVDTREASVVVKP